MPLRSFRVSGLGQACWYLTPLCPDRHSPSPLVVGIVRPREERGRVQGHSGHWFHSWDQDVCSPCSPLRLYLPALFLGMPTLQGPFALTSIKGTVSHGGRQEIAPRKKKSVGIYPRCQVWHVTSVGFIPRPFAAGMRGHCSLRKERSVCLPSERFACWILCIILGGEPSQCFFQFQELPFPSATDAPAPYLWGCLYTYTGAVRSWSGQGPPRCPVTSLLNLA